jgi:hypothetical protein
MLRIECVVEAEPVVGWGLRTRQPSLPLSFLGALGALGALVVNEPSTITPPKEHHDPQTISWSAGRMCSICPLTRRSPYHFQSIPKFTHWIAHFAGSLSIRGSGSA